MEKHLCATIPHMKNRCSTWTWVVHFNRMFYDKPSSYWGIPILRNIDRTNCAGCPISKLFFYFQTRKSLRTSPRHTKLTCPPGATFQSKKSTEKASPRPAERKPLVSEPSKSHWGSWWILIFDLGLQHLHVFIPSHWYNCKIWQNMSYLSSWNRIRSSLDLLISNFLA